MAGSDSERSRETGPTDTLHTVTTANGDRVAYTTYGDPDGAPVLFLHGTPGSRRLGTLFDDEARERGLSIIAADRPGYGESPARPDRTPTDVVEGLDAVLAAAGVTRAGVVAFSGGSRYALALAAETDHHIDRVDLIAGSVPPRFEDSPPRVQWLLGRLANRTPRTLAALVRGQAWIARHASPSFVTAPYTGDGAKSSIPQQVEECVRRDFLAALRQGGAGFVQETRELRTEWGVESEAIDCDVHCWHGDRDNNVPLPSVRRFVSALDLATLSVCEGADHLGTLVEARPAVLDTQRDTLA